MKELFELSFSPVNAVFSIMSIVMVLYWLLVIFTGLDPEFFDIHFDADADANLHAEAVDVHTHGKDIHTDEHEPNFFIGILKFFNFDELPLMFLLTILFFCMWFISINVSSYLGSGSSSIGFLLLIPNFFISLFAIKFLAKPLAYLYKHIDHKGEVEIDFIGRRCVVVSTLKGDKIGQAELVVNGDPIKIYAKSNSGEELKAGQQAVIINENIDKKFYLLEKFDY